MNAVANVVELARGSEQYAIARCRLSEGARISISTEYCASGTASLTITSKGGYKGMCTVALSDLTAADLRAIADACTAIAAELEG